MEFLKYCVLTGEYYKSKDFETDTEFFVFVQQMTSTTLIMEENKVLKNPGNAQPLELDVSVYLIFFFCLIWIIKTKEIIACGTFHFCLYIYYTANCTTNW